MEFTRLRKKMYIVQQLNCQAKQFQQYGHRNMCAHIQFYTCECQGPYQLDLWEQSTVFSPSSIILSLHHPLLAICVSVCLQWLIKHTIKSPRVRGRCNEVRQNKIEREWTSSVRSRVPNTTQINRVTHCFQCSNRSR